MTSSWSVFRFIAAVVTIFVVSSATFAAGRCEDMFFTEATWGQKLWAGLSKNVIPLNFALNKKMSLYGHFVTLDSKARAVLKISYLDAHSSESNRVIFEAIKSGQIDEIDAGSIAGPKVLPLLLGLSRITPSQKKMVVRGSLRAERIHDAILREEPLLDENGHRNYNHFSERDLERWQKAIEDLGLLEACRNFFGAANLSTCGRLNFTLDARFPEKIVWEMGE